MDLATINGLAKIKAPFGARIKQFREEKGLSRKALGKAVKLAQSSIYRLENGETWPEYDSLKRIASKLGKPVETLFASNAYVREPTDDEILERVRAGLAALRVGDVEGELQDEQNLDSGGKIPGKGADQNAEERGTLVSGDGPKKDTASERESNGSSKKQKGGHTQTSAPDRPTISPSDALNRPKLPITDIPPDILEELRQVKDWNSVRDALKKAKKP